MTGRQFLPSLGPSAITDVGNAERFAFYYGDTVRYIPASKTWLTWDDQRWRADDLQGVNQLAQGVARGIYREAEAAADADDRRMLAKWAQASENANRLRAMLECTQPLLAARIDAFDRDPMLLTVANGTLDLSTGTLRPFDREDYITKASPVVWDPDAPCPRWEQFIAEITAGRAELGAFLQRAWGSTLTGASLRDQSALLCYGGGANGKGTMVNVMRAVMGDYAVEADFSTFVEQPPEKPRPDLARLAGARLVYAEENKEGARLSEAVIKNVTGGGKVVARFLYGREFEYTPTFKLWLATNHRPVITATDYGMWRRIHLVPFNVRFDTETADVGLEDQLRATELPEILAWAVAGCLAWQEDGLAPPECVRAATAEYREASDLVGQFLAECCAEGGEADAGPLYRAYVEWAEANGERRLSSTMFGLRLGDRGIERGRRYVGRRDVPTRKGVHLLLTSVAESETWQHRSGVGR